MNHEIIMPANRNKHYFFQIKTKTSQFEFLEYFINVFSQSYRHFKLISH